jgi:HPt (histidine-containing phosphotransfer) domain-containing protein
MDDLPVIDDARLQLISRGNAAFAAEFLEALFEEAGGLIRELPAHIAAHDGTAVEGVAHRLKGMATELGAMRLRATAAALEKEPEPTHWPRYLERLRLALDELRALDRQN